MGYTPEISHGVLVEMAEHRKELEKKTKPILDTLRSYQDLPPVILFSDLHCTIFCVLRILSSRLEQIKSASVCTGQSFGCFSN